MKSATKKIHGGAKKLQEAFSHGASSSDSNTHHLRNRLFQNQNSNDSLVLASESGGEDRSHIFGSTIRSKMSFGSTDDSAYHLHRFFRKQSSHESNEAQEIENQQSFGSSLRTRMSISSLDPPSTINSSQQRPNYINCRPENEKQTTLSVGPREAMANGEVRVGRLDHVTSGVSSACSVDESSASFDGLPMILSEGDEMNDTDWSTADEVVGEIGDSKKRRLMRLNSSCTVQ